MKKQCILWYSGEGEEPFPQDYNITMKCKADAGILLEEIVDLFTRGNSENEEVFTAGIGNGAFDIKTSYEPG